MPVRFPAGVFGDHWCFFGAVELVLRFCLIFVTFLIILMYHISSLYISCPILQQ